MVFFESLASRVVCLHHLDIVCVCYCLSTPQIVNRSESYILTLKICILFLINIYILDTLVQFSSDTIFFSLKLNDTTAIPMYSFLKLIQRRSLFISILNLISSLSTLGLRPNTIPYYFILIHFLNEICSYYFLNTILCMYQERARKIKIFFDFFFYVGNQSKRSFQNWNLP